MTNKLISAEALKTAIRDDASIDGRNYARMKMHINEAQAVDAVEVVRCKDCVHMKNQFHARWCNVWCMYNGMGDDGFCNYGERKEDG